ncbi:MAG TPA: glycosyltransferase [Pirellulales bacterium]|nr:glycosyltransferase [Pirellulales bacterium]
MNNTTESAIACARVRLNPLRVLSVIPGGSGSGSMIFAKRQTHSLVGEGVENRNFFLASRTSPWRLWREIWRFRKEIREFQPHVVHTHFGTMTALFCAASTGLPLVITFRGSDLNPCPSMRWWRSFLGRLFSHLSAVRAQHIICVSLQLRRRLWWRQKQISVIPSGVDTDDFRPLPRDQARRELGWGAKDVIVLFNAGKSPAVKRLDLAQAAVEVARREAPAARMVVLDGFTAPQFLPLMMSAADCLLLTSDWEGSPTVVQEALACNLPVVTVNVGDVRERLQGVESTAIVPRNAAAIGKALAAMVMPPRRSNGRAFTEEISLRAIAPQIVDIYRAVLHRPTPAARTDHCAGAEVGGAARAA